MSYVEAIKKEIDSIEILHLKKNFTIQTDKSGLINVSFDLPPENMEYYLEKCIQESDMSCEQKMRS